MIHRISRPLALVTLLFLVTTACGSDDDSGKNQAGLESAMDQTHLGTEILTKRLETLEDQFATAQSDLAFAQQALQITLEGVTGGSNTLHQDKKVAQEARTALSADTSDLQTALVTSQKEITDTDLLLDDLKNSFFLTRNEVELNAREMQSNSDAVSKLQKAQARTATAITALESDLAGVKQTNLALQAKVDAATVYAETSDAYFEYANAITQAARNAAFLALEAAVEISLDDDLENAFENWAQASTLEEQQLLSVFLDVLGTKLLLSLRG